jgi:hypothetical protein
MWRRTLSAALLVFALLLPPAASAEGEAEGKSFLAVGSAPAPAAAAGPAAAREAALADALQSAVCLAVLEVVGAERFAESMKKLGPLLERPTDAVLDYKVLAEGSAAGRPRSIVQATVAVGKLRGILAGAGLKAAEEAPVRPIFLTVEGTDNLPGFVRFRKALGAVEGVGGLQVREMRAREALLAVGFRGGAGDLAAVLRRPPFDGLALAVSEEGGDALRVRLSGGP